jgi:hypothetical protein
MAEEDEDESPHVNADETDEEAQDTGPAFDDDLDSEVDDCIFMAMVHLVNPHHFVCASSMVSRRLVKVFAKNSKPKGFEDIVLTSLHIYADVFSEIAFDSLPECHKWDHTIELEHEPSPGFCKVYLITLIEQTEMDTFLEEALIRQSKSPLGAPVFFIKKKDGKLRFVQDYQALNVITRKNRYLLPLINNLIHQLKDTHYFTKLDICWGYNNVHIREGNEWKAAFCTNRGLFELLVMYFGLTNSRASFQIAILDSQMRYNHLEYLVKWKGHDKSHNQWEVHIQVHAKLKIAQFHRKYPSAARHINAAIFNSIPFTRADLATSCWSSCIVTPCFEGGVM